MSEQDARVGRLIYAVDLPHLVRDVLRAAFGGGRDA